MDHQVEEYNKPTKQPKTIEELKLWYVWHNLPPEEVTRFFIGKDITEPKAFGIYKNEWGEYVVYKNKASGERAIRYQGRDEAFAVNEILQRLRDEIASQKARNKARKESVRSQTQAPMRSQAQSSRSSGSSPIFTKKEKGFLGTIIAGIIALMMFASGNGIPNGYYQYQGQSYYRQGSAWYRYQPSTNDWYETTTPGQITKDNADQYRLENFNGKRFEDSQWYDNGSSDNDSWDNDDWDNDDDWDDSDTDWDSDW